MADMGKPVALGRTAELYAWPEDRVLKLYFDWFDLENIQFEQRMAQSVHTAGLPVPAVGDIVQVNGRNGLIYERVDGQEMWSAFQKRPWQLATLARQTAQLHAEMHANTLRPDLPSQRRRLENKLHGADALPANLKAATLAALSTLPDGDRICHGDFHPGNIMLTSTRAVIIDWIDASLGNPLADVARTTVILLGAAASSQITEAAQKFIIRLFHSFYLRRYFQLRPCGEAEYRRWLPVVAAARLSEAIPELEAWLVGQVQKGVQAG
jgi:uncharacterized protein (TIGR02172 family)